jgi:tRNA (guanine10-N2)-dimethyltransferase
VSNFNARSVCILGRQPALGLVELESLYGPDRIKQLGKNSALLDIDAGDINFTRLGGTIKVAKILARLPSQKWADIEKYLIQNIPLHLAHLPGGKFTLGISAYDISVGPDVINKTNLKIKQEIKKSGRPVRVVPNKSTALNSAQVLHNSLIKLGGWELLVIGSGSGALLAQTMFVQDIEAYGARDQSRPKRDARVGMLPPKLAQIIINLAAGVESPVHILDPFCGTGVVLQEALLMGYEASGTDLEPKMIDYSNENLEWLKKRYPQIGKYNVALGDATEYSWKTDFNAVACETYLGRPLNSLPEADKLKEIVNDVNTIIEKFLKNMTRQLKKDTPLCLAVPAWRNEAGKLTHLPLIDRLGSLGYNLVKFKTAGMSELIYFRENQTVARQLLVLNKR